MTELEQYDAARMREDVAKLMLQGKSELAVARILSITRVEAKNHWQTWQQLLQNDMESTEAAKEYLNRTVKHYDRLIDESYKLLEDLKNESFSHQVASQINATLKNISEYEAKRVAMLRDAGVLDGADLGDQLAQMEDERNILLDILRNDLCEDCQATVARRIQEITKVVEVVRVDDE